ncbi:MAG: nucleotide sugar dehydrogenase [Chloroflexota bacterium]
MRAAVAPSVSSPTAAIVGMGYVGLPTALALLNAGTIVIGIDNSHHRLRLIETGDVDLTDADHERLAAWQGDPRFLLTTDTRRIADADVVLVCVPTPVDEHQVPDLQPLAGACRAIVAAAVPGQLIVLTSTSYVGSTRDLLVKPLEASGFTVGEDIHVAFSPERIDPGNQRYAQADVPRVIGGTTPLCSRLAADVISRISPVHIVSSPEAAEMTKLLENIYRAVNIALVNEIADASDELGLDIHEVVEAAATKPFGFTPFRPGIGVGGHCIACDPHYLLWQMRARRTGMPLIEQAMASITARPGRVVDMAITALAETGVPVRRARILVVGLAYKPGVSDVRESPAIEIIERLTAMGAGVDVFDPHVREARAGEDVIRSIEHPDPDDYDIAIVATLHPDVDYRWLAAFGGRVVDPSGRSREHRGGPFLSAVASPDDVVTVGDVKP